MLQSDRRPDRAARVVLLLAIVSGCGSRAEFGDSGASESLESIPPSHVTEPATPTTPTIADVATVPSTDGVDAVDPDDADDRMAIDALLSGLTELDIELLGGLGCATELAVVAVAFRHFETDRGRRSEQIDEVLNAGYLKEPPKLWSHFHIDELVPHENSGCRAPSEVDIYKGCLERADELRSERTTYLAQNPGAPEPMQDDLVEAGLRKYFDSSIDIIEGVVVGVHMDVCEEVDFG